MLIFEQSQSNRRNPSQAPLNKPEIKDIPEKFRRKQRPLLPEVSEMQAVRHYTRLSQKNFSIDTQFYPLGSCTMKYNPRACNQLAMLPQFLARHPSAPETTGQGFLACMYELQEILKDVTGMRGVSLTPAAGAQDIADALTSAGIRGILNFAPRKLFVPKHVTVRNVDMTLEFESLSFALAEERSPRKRRARG